MKISAKQAKLFRRVKKRFKVTDEFVHRNMNAMLKFVQYAITPRIVLKRKLIRNRNRVFLRHNNLQKLIFDPTKLKKRQRSKRIHSQWSKRLVMYLRHNAIIKYVEEKEEKNAIKPAHINKDVSEQLKKQLELLKSGRRIVPLIEETHKSIPTEYISQVNPLSSNDMIEKKEKILRNTNPKIFEKNDNAPKVPLLSAVHITEAQFKDSNSGLINNRRNNESFIDMLISKVNNKHCEAEKSMEPPKKHIRIFEKEVAENEERENSNSSSDFFGFEDNERILGSIPGMMSTPLVPNCGSNSAFVSETLNTFLRDNSLESSTTANYLQTRPDDGQVLANSDLPKLNMPALPEGLQGLRTVAERRAFLQKNKNTKYCLINNMATIFRELQKKSKGHRIYKQAIEPIITNSFIPMTRQGWKAAIWLLTDIGNYYCQTITVDGKDYRLYGGQGNYSTKFKKPHSNFGHNILPACSTNCIDRITFCSLKPIRSLKEKSKLSDSFNVTYKPCPLSQKILHQSHEEESVFGSLNIVRMPEVKLEVFPQLQRPLSDVAKRYLQLILPYNDISREWAEFSVSTLLESENMDISVKKQKTFTFKLPYANDRNHLIIRRVYNRSEKFESKFNNSDFSFRKKIGEPPDSLSIECADMLTEMLNSVAIACSENSFIKDDPDLANLYAGNEVDIMEDKSVKKVEPCQHNIGASNKKQSRLLNEMKRLNATVIDAATTKLTEGRTYCGKECCLLGCVCASLSEGKTIRQHCGKQKCILECKCKCLSIMRLETDGHRITEEDAFMIRRQATARLARMEKEFTSTIVLTGSETFLINESQYEKKRRCTKVPKRYGDFIDPDSSDIIDFKQSIKRSEMTHTPYLPLEPVFVNENVYKHLKHCSVRLKKLNDVKDLFPWCMVHMVYKCFCKGQSTSGNPIEIEKQEESVEITPIDELILKNRSFFRIEEDEIQKNREWNINTQIETSDANEKFSELNSLSEKNQNEKRGRISDNNCIDVYMNAKPNHCRRVVPIPRNIYKRRNKKRLAHIQLYITENENVDTRLSLHEHILRSVYFHKDNNEQNHKTISEVKIENKVKSEEAKSLKRQNYSSSPFSLKKSKISVSEMDQGSSLLLVNRYKNSLNPENSKLFKSLKDHPKDDTPKYIPKSLEEIKIPKISQIFSLNTEATQLQAECDTPRSILVAPSVSNSVSRTASAIEISEAPAGEMALTHGVSTEAFKNVFKQVIKNMNNLVSKKMQDIDMALRRESKAIPAPNAEILCIIRWNNFLEAYLENFFYLWEVRTASVNFLAATIKPMMPLVINAMSVINIQTISRNKLPLLGRMLIDRKQSPNSEGLAVVMQGQKMYWIVKGFLRPDKARICPKPTPETHPLLTRKINVLCRLLINNQFNEHKRRQDAMQAQVTSNYPSILTKPAVDNKQQPSPNDSSIRIKTKTSICSKSPFCLTFDQTNPDKNDVSLKLKVLPMQRNISDQATAILEEMVSQAYGFVRTNILLRKIRSCELCEIFPPTKLSSNHHWLVLDVTNDFSHIFIPELKDLLTLDRIQKVMTYSLSKNRIVKMQFSQKSLFNAYVTPKSTRKLYFGPFRQNVNSPKLVLLQSVDGQMMLREVYESRHNIVPKTLKTTSFWVIQNCGKMYLDLEEDQNAKDQNSVPFEKSKLNHKTNSYQKCEKGINDIQKYESNHIEDINLLPQINIPIKQNALLRPHQNVEKIQQQTVKGKDNKIMEFSNTFVSSNPSQTQKYLDNKNSQNIKTGYCADADDDCIIVGYEQHVPSIAHTEMCVLNLPSSSTILKPLPPSDTGQTNSYKTNYTISYTGENSTLVVIQNQCDRNSDVQPSAHNFSVIPEIQNPNVEPVIQIKSICNISSEDCKSPSPNEINDILTLPINNSKTTTTLSSLNTDLATFFSSGSKTSKPTQSTSTIEPKSNLSSNHVKTPQVLHSEVRKRTIGPDSKTSNTNKIKLNEVPLKLNKNVTIKKLIPGVKRKSLYSINSIPSVSCKTEPIISSSNTKAVNSLQTQIPTGVTSQADQHFVEQTTKIQEQKVGSACSPKKTDGNVDNNQQNLQLQTERAQVFHIPSSTSNIIDSNSQCLVRKISGSSIVIPEPNSCSVNFGLQTQHSPFENETILTKAAVSSNYCPQQLLVQSQLNNAVKRTLNHLTSEQILKTPSLGYLQINENPRTSLELKTTQLKQSNSMKPIINETLQANKNPSHNFNSQAVQNKTEIHEMINQSTVPIQGDNINLHAPSFVTPNYEINKHNTIRTQNLSLQKPSTVGVVPETSKQITTLSKNIRLKVATVMATNLKTSEQVSKQKNQFSLPVAVHTSVIRSQAQVEVTKRMVSKVVPYTPKKISIPIKQDSQLRGIDASLAPLKKLRIINSPTKNTTIITPLSSNMNTQANNSQAISVNDSGSINPGNSIGLQKKNTLITPLTTTTSSSIAKTSLDDPPIATAEYGYFYANIDGVPKFVVKRVGDDFLIKVPNFNGILKLCGLATVHNYLNQYTMQKCGKTNEDISNLKWTFKMQDRSKLNINNKPKSPNFKTSNNNIVALKTNPSEQNTISTCPAPKKITMKPSSTPENFEPNDLIDLSDEE